MARKIRDNDLDTRNARAKLSIRGRLYYRRIEANLAIGYRKLRNRSGTWTARTYVGKGEYSYQVIGEADDRSDANGLTVFSFDQAVAKARALHIEAAKKEAGIHAPTTVSEAMESYVAHLDHGGKNTYNLEGVVKIYIEPLLGDVEIAKLTTKDLTKWLADCAAMPPRGKRKHDQRARRLTANRNLIMLKAALNLAYRDGKVESDRAWKAVKPFKGVVQRRERFLTVAEAKRLVNAADADFRPMIQAALATGCRYAELANLTVADFNVESQTLAIKHSRKRAGHVFLTDEGVQLFEGLAAGKRPGDPLIRRSDGLPWGVAHQVRRMKQTCENARIEPITFHGLRHTFASALVKAGVPLAYVAESLGHTSIAMVTKHYGHFEQSHVAETIRASVPKYGFATSNVRTLKPRV